MNDLMSDLMDDARLVYLYDGTLEGMLTSVFEAFRRKEEPLNVAWEQNLQQNMLCSYIPILTDIALAKRVRNGIGTTLGERVYDNVKQVFLSDDVDKGGVIVRYLLYTMRKGSKACAHLAHPAVNAFEDVLSRVSKEAHYMLQFVRFAQLENGVYFSRIEPKASVVPLIMGHFAARFNIQPFMIHDPRHGLVGVFDTERWWLVDARDIHIPPQTKAEDGFQSLWQTFYDTIAIEERLNPRCQQNFMPKRFWGTMCEQIPPQLRNLRPKTETPTTVAKRLTRGLLTRTSSRADTGDAHALLPSQSNTSPQLSAR
jgi:probable DNA metabolism protein